MNSNHAHVFVTDISWLWKNATKATYPVGMLKNGIKTDFLLNSVGNNAIFVKIDKNSRKVQEVHEGIIAKVELQGEKIYFEYGALKPISSINYLTFNQSGCYLDTNNRSKIQKASRYQEEQDLLLQITNFNSFEDMVHKLIYQLHVDLRTIPREKQAGKSDGFFKINSLNVLYDVTLQEKFEDFKETQIENFVSQMKKSYFELGKERFTLDVESEKQVWIITKNCDKHIRTEDGIKIRAVSVNHLYSLLQMFHDNLSSNEEQRKMLSIL